ncbi:reverse transcriptase domain-containing protein [Tanacetum coccineum]
MWVPCFLLLRLAYAFSFSIDGSSPNMARKRTPSIYSTWTILGWKLFGQNASRMFKKFSRASQSFVKHELWQLWHKTRRHKLSAPDPAPALSKPAAANYNQVSSNFRPQMVANHIRPPGFPPVQNSQANNANNFNRGNNFNQNRESNFNQNRGGNFNQSNFSQNQLHRPQVNQSPAYQAPVPQTHSVTKNDFDNYVKANDAIMRNMQNNLQNQGQSMQIETNKLNNQMANLTDMLAKFVTANTASTSGSGTLPGNTVTNPREDLKGITTRSGVAYQGPPIPTSSVVKPIPEVTKDQVHPSCSQSTAPVQPPVGPEPITTPVLEPIVAPVVAPVPNTKPSVSLPYPSRRDNEKSRNQANEQIDKFYEIFKEMSFEISFTDALVLMPKFASTLRTLLGNKEKLTEVARTSNEPCLARTSMNEHCSAVILNKLPRKLGDPGKFLIPCEFPGMDECLALADLGASINLMPFSVWEKLSLPDLTPTCMTLELADRSISKPMGIAKDISVKVGVFHFPADFVVVDFEPDPRVPLILGRCFLNYSGINHNKSVYYLRWTQGLSPPHSSPILPHLPSTTHSCYPLAEVVDGKTVEEIKTKIIAKDGTVTRYAPHRLPQPEMNGWLMEDDEELERNEVDSDLESTACSKPVWKKTSKAYPDRTSRNCPYCSK